MLLMLYTHPSRAASLLEPERIKSDPLMPISVFTDGFGNHCGRIVAPAGPLRLWHDAVVRDTGLPDPVCPAATQHEVVDLPPDVVPFLLGSRHCRPIGCRTSRGICLVICRWAGRALQGVCDWVHNNVKFGYEFARPTKSAYDVFNERQGVCRDFTHLFNAFLRCLNIPARMPRATWATSASRLILRRWISAWSEVFLDNRWFTFDARHNVPRIGRIVMARGRDATDVAMTTSFGPSNLLKFQVITEEAAPAVSIAVNPTAQPARCR